MKLYHVVYKRKGIQNQTWSFVEPKDLNGIIEYVNDSIKRWGDVISFEITLEKEH